MLGVFPQCFMILSFHSGSWLTGEGRDSLETYTLGHLVSDSSGRGFVSRGSSGNYLGIVGPGR